MRNAYLKGGKEKLRIEEIREYFENRKKNCKTKLVLNNNWIYTVDSVDISDNSIKFLDKNNEETLISADIISFMQTISGLDFRR